MILKYFKFIVVLVFVSTLSNFCLGQTFCSDLDFESGTLAGWTTSGNVVLTSTGVDPYGGFPVSASPGNYSVQLGNKLTSVLSTIQRSFLVTNTNSIFSYQYAMVLLDYPHSASDAAYINIDIFDNAMQPISCAHYKVFAAAGGPPGFLTSPAPAEGNYSSECCYNISYKPWTPVSVDLTPYVGQNVTIKVDCDWCVYDVDWGYCYMDFGCSNLVVHNNCSSSCIVAPPGFQSYSWTGPGIVSGSNTDSCCVNQSGTYNVYITSLSGCSINVDTNITVIPSTVNPNISGNLNVCNGNSTTLTASGGSTYIWSNSSTTPSITVSPPTTTTYTVTVSDISGCSASTSVTVNVSAGSAEAGNDQNICLGQSANLSASGGSTYVWSPSGTLNNANIANPIATPTTTTMYYVTVSNGTCIAVDSLTITVNPSPNLNVTNTSICNGVADTLFASGATTYSWNIGGTNSYIIVNPATTTTYTVTGTTGGCTATASGTVTVNGVPNPQISASNNATCGLNNGGATATGGGTYLWSSGQNTATITSLAGGTYTVTVSSGAGCSATTSVIINVITPPTVTASSIDENCGHANGSASSNTINGTTPYTYLWSNGQTTQNITNLIGNTYTVTVTDADGCTTTASVVVTNIAGPSLQVVSTVNDICTYGNGSATVNAIGGQPPYSYLWSNGNNGTTATVLFAGSYSCTVTDANNCTALNSVLITDSPGPSLTSSSLNEICDQANGSATVNPNGGTPPYTYLWSNGQATQTATGLTQGSYTVTVNDQNCSAVMNVNVLETPGPDAGFSAHPKVLTIMDGPVTFTDNSSGNIVNWNWNFGDGSIGSGEDIDHAYPNIGIYLVTLIITDNNGCMDTVIDTIKVKDIFTFYIPNTFTPNDDGYNDFFFPQGVSVDPDNFEMFIFDRWGNMMFDTRKWDATLHRSESWNGTKDNKGTFKDVVMDVYVYRIKAKEIDGPKHEYIGRISLIP